MNVYDADRQIKRVNDAFSPLNNSVTPPLEISPFMVERELGKMPKPKRKMSRARLAAVNIALAAVLCVSIVGFGLLNIRDSNSMMGGAHDVKAQNNPEQTADIGTAAKTDITAAATAAVSTAAIKENTSISAGESTVINRLNKLYSSQKGYTKKSLMMNSDVVTTGGDPEFSETNVQEQGVKEGDTVITDGEYIFKLRTDIISGDSVANYVEIVNAKTMKKISQIKVMTECGFFEEMYLSDNLLTVLESEKWYGNSDSGKKTLIRIYDVSNKTAPKLRSKHTVSGELNSSRMVDGILYTVTSDNIFVDRKVTKKNLESFLPKTETNGDSVACRIDDIYSIGENISRFANISALNTMDKSAKMSIKSVMCNSLNDVYYTKNTAYLFSALYYENEKTGDESKKTDFIKFNLSGDKISADCKFSAEGSVDDRLYMSERNGYFRVVMTETTYKNDVRSTQSGVYVFDKNGKQVGSITGLGKNEDVYSVRFEGDICYFVTYKTKDPLFAVDLSNPKKPKLISKLESPGYSTYLYRVKGYLVGVGKTDNGTPKISLFGKDGKTELDTVQLQDTLISISRIKIQGIECELNELMSPAVYDFHAFCANENSGDILIPYFICGSVVSEYRSKAGLTVYTVDNGKLLEKRVLVARSEKDIDWYNNRAMYIDNYYFYIDDDCIIRYDSANNYAEKRIEF